MRDGLYRVLFQTPLGWGSGIVYASGGRLWGGDAGLFYVGTYKREGDNVVAEVRTDRHTQHPGITSVFGRDQVKITLAGVSSGDTVRLRGNATEAPGVDFTAELTRLSD
jgi:T3SS negative regulator,GrlR